LQPFEPDDILRLRGYMKQRFIKYFEEQFGREWSCSCKTSFDPAYLDVISETDNTLLAHYSCPVCQKEQMLAAVIREDLTRKENSNLSASVKLPIGNLTSDDLLDIKDEISKIKTRGIQRLYSKTKSKRENPININKFLPPNQN